MTQTLVSTKFYMPAARPSQVPRERLQHSFEQALTSKLTLVSAPAGFGKTTLVSGEVRRAGHPVAWLSLDARDSDVTGFIRSLTTAVQQTREAFGHTTFELLNATQPVPSEVLMTALLNDLATIDQPWILVLDDYHVVESPLVDEALAFLLEHQPPAMHLVVATREDPSLPLARLRAGGELGEIRAADLRFSQQECEAFLIQSNSLTLTVQQCSALQERTEGWVAGLQLAALSLQGRELRGEHDNVTFIKDFTGSHRFVIDYLAEEVLTTLSEPLRDFLMQTSILKRFNASLCDAVTAGDNSAEFIQQLDRNNLFLIALDDQRHWYRYHHLFADVLQSQRQTAAGSDQLLHARASHWYEQQELYSEAIEHALLANEATQAVSIIEAVWPQMRKLEPESTYLGWMKMLPESAIADSPVLAAYYGMILLSIDLDAAMHWIDTAEQQLQGADEKPELAHIAGQLAVARSYHAGATGDYEKLTAQAALALELLPDNEAVWRGSAAVLLGLVQWGSGDLITAAQSINTGYQAMKNAGEVSGAVSCAFLLANVRISQGQRVESARVCKKALSLAQQRPIAPQGTADIHTTLAALAAAECEFDRARAHLQTAKQIGEQAQLAESAHLWFVVQSLIEAINGDYHQATDLLAEAIEIRIPSPTPEFHPLEGWQARLDILKGDLGSAGRWLESSGVSLQQPPELMLEYAHLTLARHLIARSVRDNNPDQARQVVKFLQQLADAVISENREGSLLEIRLLQTLAHHAAADTKKAKQALLKAIQTPEAALQVHRFVIEGERAQKALTELLPADAPDWLCRVLKTNLTVPAPAETSKPPPVALPEPLSDREQQVLQQLHSDLTGPEIAGQLFISLNTLRTHIKNIYAKLDVNNRRAAVRRATELGI